MGLEFKTFNTLASRMSSFATISGLGPIGPSSKPAAKAPAAKASAAPAAAPLECAEFNAGNQCRRGQKCHDKRCKDASAKAPKSAVKSGDGGVSAQLAAMQKKLDQIEVKIDSGFEAQEKRSLALQEKGSKAYAETMEMFKGFGHMITGGFTAINTSHRELPAPSARLAICTGGGSNATEVIEQPRRYLHSCFAPNEGGSASHSSQRPQSSAACGGSSAGSQYLGQNGWSEGQSYGSVSRPPADQRIPTSGSGYSAPAPQSLAELMGTIPETTKGFLGLGRRILSDAAAPGAKPVPQFTFHKFLFAWQMSGGNDDLACALMAATYGKPLSQQRLQPGIANALKTTDIGVFKEFFRRISVQYPSFVLTYNWKGPSGPERKTPYGTFSSDQNLLIQFIHGHLLA